MAALALLGAALTAHAALASLDQMRAPDPPPAPARGFEADDHFPGALYFELAADDVAPAAGVTGTTTLPDLPVPAIAGDASIAAAAPFAFRGSSTDRARAAECLTSAIYYEAAREPENGQRAVAQVVLNRVRNRAFPDSVCGVVYQGSEQRGCQFSFACDESLARAPDRKYWLRAKLVAEAALSGAVFAPVGLATHYHTYAVTPAWNRSLVMTGVFGAHFFHRWKGWWGTPAAFDEHYAGGEPLPGPHRASPTATPIPVEAGSAGLPAKPADSVPSPSPATAAQAQPHYAESGTVTAALPQSQILDKWKDSGTPLR